MSVTGDAGDYTVTVTLNGCSSQSTIMLPSMQDPLQMLPATVLCAWVVTSIFQLQVPVPVQLIPGPARMDLALLQTTNKR
jgi:hypothetical protein